MWKLCKFKVSKLDQNLHASMEGFPRVNQIVRIYGEWIKIHVYSQDKNLICMQAMHVICFRDHLYVQSYFSLISIHIIYITHLSNNYTTLHVRA